MTCSSTEGSNIDAVWGMLLRYEASARDCGEFVARRDRQARDWMHQLIDELLKQRLRDSEQARKMLPGLEADVLARKMTPFNAARQLIDCL
jgi:LAO/AO transport system kinase